MKEIIAKIRPYAVPLIIAVLMLLAVIKPQSISQQSAATILHNALSQQTEVLDKFLKDEQAKKQFITRFDRLDGSFRKNNIALFCYENDKLIAYSDNESLPVEISSFYTDGSAIVKQKNGYYHLIKRTEKNGKTWIGLALLLYDYKFQNNFLKNGFVSNLDLPDDYKLSLDEVKGGDKVIDTKGNVVAWIYTDTTSVHHRSNYLSVLLNILLLLFVIYYLYQSALTIASKYGRLQGLLFFVGIMVLMRILMVYFLFPAVFSGLELFDPTIYASNFFSKSLGDLLLSVLFLIVIAIFFYNINPQLNLNFFPFSQKWVEIAVLLVLIVVMNFVVLLVFKSLIIDSNISFEVYDVLSLTIYSAVGLLCLSFLLAVHFLFNTAIIKRLSVLYDNWYVLSALLLFLFILAEWVYDSEMSLQVLSYTFIWLIVYNLILYKINKEIFNFNRLSRLIIFILLYSNLSMFMIEKLYEEKERNQRMFFADKLLIGNDYIAEFSFKDIGQRLVQDRYLQSYFSNPILSKSNLKDRFNLLYFSGYFSKYEVDFYTFDEDYNIYKSSDTSSYATLKKNLGFAVQDTTKNTFVFVNDSLNNYAYVGEFEIVGDGNKSGTVLFRLRPRIYNGQSVYPELLIGADVATVNNKSSYSYAIYVNEKLIIQSGDYPYPYYFDRRVAVPEKGEVDFYETYHWEHLLKNATGNTKVIVSVKQEGFFEPIATASYFFVLYLLVFLSFFAVYNIYYYFKLKEQFFSLFHYTFQSKINIAMLSIIVLSFIIIGVITISFYHTQYDEFYTDRLVKKQKNIQVALAYFFLDESADFQHLNKSDFHELLGVEIAKLSETNTIDINIYDTTGVLMVSSQPPIFDYGLVSKMLHPAAYQALHKQSETHFTQQEHIGKLHYLAAYAPVKNNTGQTIAYLSVPYFAKSSTLKQEVSLFLVNLINAYVFLLLCAAVMAYLISNSITRPLRFISEKLRILNLNKKNEHIEWRSKDEIGVLIAEYNKMITELENSATKLAKNERESAWREMARQIAHEIKNPLTPMKLSIQYLQRAIDEDNPNVRDLAQKVNKTLIEQIENLSSIATAFSSFAQMPKGNSEPVDLNNLIKGVIDLFSKDTECDIQFMAYKENAIVFADKNQIISVVNNLLKNAIQAIPEDRKGEIMIITLEEYGMIKTVVIDNGVGIAPESYEKVFVPNFTTKSSGTGLGLAIVKQIIENAGGEIWFQSVENESTSFYFTLPYYDKK